MINFALTLLFVTLGSLTSTKMLKSSSLTRFSMMSQHKSVFLEGREQSISYNKYLQAFTPQYLCMVKQEVAKHSLWKDISTPGI